ncbi:MAG: TRAP transporter permease [Geminicoccaceae bacterium]
MRPASQRSKAVSGWLARLRDLFCAALTLFALYVAAFGVFDTIIVYGTAVVLGATITFLDFADEAPLPLLVIHSILAIGFALLIWRWSGIMLEQEEFFVDIQTIDYRLAWVAFALIIYLTWRAFGLPMLVVLLAVLAYALAPLSLGGAGLDWASVADRQWFTTDGVFGRPVQVVSTVVLVFIVFGAVLQSSGAGAVLLRLAFAATGRIPGGPAHAAIVGSALFGTLSGAAVANVVSTGVFTIPIIKRAGFRARFAGAVEAAASTGGQIMPPVMGVVAFIMADVTGVPYLSIIVAALIPALFYYLSLFVVVLIEARRQGIGPVPPDQRERITRLDWLRSGVFWTSLAVIVGTLLTGRTAQNAGFYATILAATSSLVLFPQFRRPDAWWNALVTAGRTAGTLMVIVAAVGLVIGIVNMSGIGLAFADAIRSASGDGLFIALLFVMLGCLVIGMGVPSVPAYLMLALVMGPVLEGMGVPKVPAHLFMVYFGVLSVVTPPVALAAFAAAPIAGAKPFETGLEAVRLSVAGFIIPFAFVFHTDLVLILGVDPWSLVWALLALTIAVWMIATGLAGFETAPLAWPERLARVAAGLASLTPELLYAGPAAAVAIGLAIRHRVTKAEEIRGG